MDSMAATDVKLTVPDAARRLGMDGGDVYRLIFRGALSAEPRTDGAVYVDATSVDEYLADPSEGSPPPS